MLHSFQYHRLYPIVVPLCIVRMYAHDKVILDAVPRFSVIQCRVGESVRKLSVAIHRISYRLAHSFQPVKGGSQ